MAAAADNLAYEQRFRTRAIIAAALGGAIPLAGFIVRAVAIKDIPDVSIDQLVFIDKHKTALVVSAILIGLGALAEGGALYYLYRATKGRRPELQKIVMYMVFIGAIGTLVSEIAFQGALAQAAHSWVQDNPKLIDNISAKKVFDRGGLQALRGAGLAAQLALGFAFVMISLNAMRIGLLTRFVGVVGIVSGVFLVIPLLSPLPIVQAFWLISLAALFSQRWPSGMPEAWSSGESRPWPSQQQVREEREQAMKADGPVADATPADDGDAPNLDFADETDAELAAPTPHPTSKKRKKKRKR